LGKIAVGVSNFETMSRTGNAVAELVQASNLVPAREFSADFLSTAYRFLHAWSGSNLVEWGSFSI
jgi:hypothetical protein